MTRIGVVRLAISLFAMLTACSDNARPRARRTVVATESADGAARAWAVTCDDDGRACFVCDEPLELCVDDTMDFADMNEVATHDLEALSEGAFALFFDAWSDPRGAHDDDGAAVALAIGVAAAAHAAAREDLSDAGSARTRLLERILRRAAAFAEQTEVGRAGRDGAIRHLQTMNDEIFHAYWRTSYRRARDAEEALLAARQSGASTHEIEALTRRVERAVAYEGVMQEAYRGVRAMLDKFQRPERVIDWSATTTNSIPTAPPGGTAARIRAAGQLTDGTPGIAFGGALGFLARLLTGGF